MIAHVQQAHLTSGGTMATNDWEPNALTHRRPQSPPGFVKFSQVDGRFRRLQWPLFELELTLTVTFNLGQGGSPQGALRNLFIPLLC